MCHQLVLALFLLLIHFNHCEEWAVYECKRGDHKADGRSASKVHEFETNLKLGQTRTNNIIQMCKNPQTLPDSYIVYQTKNGATFHGYVFWVFSNHDKICEWVEMSFVNDLLTKVEFDHSVSTADRSVSMEIPEDRVSQSHSSLPKDHSPLTFTGSYCGSNSEKGTTLNPDGFGWLHIVSNWNEGPMFAGMGKVDPNNEDIMSQIRSQAHMGVYADMGVYEMTLIGRFQKKFFGGTKFTGHEELNDKIIYISKGAEDIRNVHSYYAKSTFNLIKGLDLHGGKYEPKELIKSDEERQAIIERERQAMIKRIRDEERRDAASKTSNSVFSQLGKSGFRVLSKLTNNDLSTWSGKLHLCVEYIFIFAGLMSVLMICRTCYKSLFGQITLEPEHDD